MSSRIEQIIEEIEEYVDSCKYQPLSTTKIVVNKEEIEELLRELRLKTPDEIKRYQKIISNKDAILEDAQTKADALIADAQNKAQELVTQHEIMQKAYAQANETINAANRQAQEILDSATQDANSIRLSAITYTDDIHLIGVGDGTGKGLTEIRRIWNSDGWNRPRLLEEFNPDRVVLILPLTGEEEAGKQLQARGRKEHLEETKLP